MVAFYLTILVILNLRMFIHTSILAFPIKYKKPKKIKSNKKVLIQYPVMNEPIYLIDRFIKSLKNIPKKERARFHLQILDDYTDPKALSEIKEIPCISYEIIRRKSRTGRVEGKLGYAKSKAGNLNYGLQQIKKNDFEYVMIYDADHQITSGKKLIEAIEILEANNDIAIAQSRWEFNNSDRSLCWLYQELSLKPHIEREQLFRSVNNLHPIMNGAGAVFKLDLIIDLFGGWLERGVVEDIDISYQLTRIGYKIHVFPEWTTKIDNPDNWSDLSKQWEKWAQGNGQILRYHLKESNISFWKKLYWISWLNSFNMAPLKYIFLIWLTYSLFIGKTLHWIEYVCLVPHIFTAVATGLRWNSKPDFKMMVLYPLYYIIELRILHVQIYNWYKGFFNYNKELEFKPTPKN